MLNSILEAIEHGRMVKLTSHDKNDALQFLGTMLEAVPSIPSGINIVEIVLSHEKTSNTSLVAGWACPHARVNYDGDLSCTIGWSMEGIDYGIPDEPLVHMIIMFFVPDNQRNAYLKEVSALVRVLKNNPQYQGLETIQDLNAIRNNLLDIAHLAMSGDAKNYRARMIQLDTLTKAAATGGMHEEGLQIEALMVVVVPDMNPVVLTQNIELSRLAEKDINLITVISKGNNYLLNDWHIVRRNTTSYTGEKFVYDCLAIKLVSAPQ